MKATLCGRLDDYLDGELDAAATCTFRRHLDDCASCRRTAAESDAVAGFLKRAFAVEQAASLLPECGKSKIPATPAATLASRSWQLRLRSSFGRFAAGLVAVAAVLLLWAAASFFWTPEPDSPPRHAADNTTLQSNNSLQAVETSSHRLKAAVRVVNDEVSVAIPMPSSHDNVTIVWIYPTVQ